MKICNVCRSQVADQYTTCPSCGSTNLTVQPNVQPQMNTYQQPAGQPMYNQAMPQYNQPMYNQPMNNQQVNQKGNFLYAIIGFLFPLIGIILYFVFKDTKPGDAKMAKNGAIVSIVIYVVFVVLIAVFAPLLSSLSSQA